MEQTVTYRMPSQFASLDDLRQFVLMANVSYLVDDIRWDIIYPVTADATCLLTGCYDTFDDDIGDGEFSIRIEYANNRLHYTVHAPSDRVMNAVVVDFLEEFNRFPQHY